MQITRGATSMTVTTSEFTGRLYYRTGSGVWPAEGWSAGPEITVDVPVVVTGLESETLYYLVIADGDMFQLDAGQETTLAPPTVADLVTAIAAQSLTTSSLASAFASDGFDASDLASAITGLAGDADELYEDVSEVIME